MLILRWEEEWGGWDEKEQVHRGRYVTVRQLCTRLRWAKLEEDEVAAETVVGMEREAVIEVVVVLVEGGVLDVGLLEKEQLTHRG